VLRLLGRGSSLILTMSRGSKFVGRCGYDRLSSQKLSLIWIIMFKYPIENVRLNVYLLYTSRAEKRPIRS
jgi:hypothetical protein